ncbi:hypothetical protein CHCC15337_4113 [Bacillus paralicheniformis]|nr:hypothetical protein CHCC15337_4113 [Bacillus paralicheniformis]
MYAVFLLFDKGSAALMDLFADRTVEADLLVCGYLSTYSVVQPSRQKYPPSEQLLFGVIERLAAARPDQAPLLYKSF